MMEKQKLATGRMSTNIEDRRGMPSPAVGVSRTIRTITRPFGARRSVPLAGGTAMLDAMTPPKGDALDASTGLIRQQPIKGELP